ncbi:hypothetical protein BASA81_004470 [Batrachochytrium salamandrivorans]|nr:hypothetical protein BASA81_004470 [Batrachochytrium salamandrivorans]
MHLPKLNFQLPKFNLYLAPTSQSSWSKRPFHVSLSSSLWTDLLLVAILFRLNEFTLSHLTPGIQGFWLPTTVFFAVYDVWETRVLFDSVFKFQDDLWHHFIGILQWLLLALMATSITPDRVWSSFDCILFSTLKLAHQTIRVYNYVETWRWSPSKRARRSARARSVVYLTSWPLYLAVPCVLGTMDSSSGSEETVNMACGLWVAGFFSQRIVWALLKWDPFPNPYIPFKQDCHMIKTNIPFKTTRYGDWSMLQLGAIVLGFMTVPIGTSAAYGTLVFGYVYVGCLNMLAYSINPQETTQHALVRGGIVEFVWLELYSLAGLCFVGIAVGLRVHLFYPEQVVLSEFRHYTWMLCVCAQISTMAMFAQEWCHGGIISRANQGPIVWYKLAASGMYMLTAVAYVLSDSQQPMFVILGIMLSSMLVLVIQVSNGAFKRRYFKNEKLKLMGHFRAAVIAMVLLHRARAKLMLTGGKISTKDTMATSTDAEDELTVFQQQIHSKVTPQRLSQIGNLARPSLVRRSGVDAPGPLGVVVKPSAQQLAAQSVKLRRHHHYHREEGSGSSSLLPHHQQSSSSIESKRSGLLFAGMNRASVSGKRRLSLAKSEIRQWKIVLNDKFYSPPHVFVEGNKATKYRVQWSDLFFDVLFVGAVFRLGDLLLSGLGAGYSESSVHFLENVLNSTVVLYYDPVHDPYRQDAVGVFATVFVAVWGMWQNRLAYGSKVGSGDVVHKVIDLSQGLAVMLIAVNITTRERMQNTLSGNAYAVAGGLVAFQLSMVFLWVELYLSPDSKASGKAKGTATRNLQRDLVSLIPLLLSFCTIYYEVALIATTVLWSLSWLLPFGMRVLALRLVNDGNAVRDLHRYVIHRLGDGALILLGEGVLQIIRAKVLVKSIYFFAAVLLGLFSVTAVRIAVWSMDCFTDSSKHAQLLSLRAGLAAYFVRSVAGPALVAMGVAMKKMVSMSYSNQFSIEYHAFYWLLCGASFITSVTQICTYELHRFASKGHFRRAEPALMGTVSCLFLVWPSVYLASWVTELLCLGTWLVIIFIHFLLDDYFLLKQMAKERGDTELLRSGSMKSAKSSRRKRGLLHALSGGRFGHRRDHNVTEGLLARATPTALKSSNRHFDKPAGEKKFYPLVVAADSSSPLPPSPRTPEPDQ